MVTAPPAAPDVLIVGGGIAGMACALRLSQAGAKVTLLETRKKLGGRATSFKDVRSDRWLDNCQHVVLGCCTNYLDLLERLGAREKIIWHTSQFWLESGGRMSVVERGPLPVPAHFSASFLRAAFLSPGEKFQIARACSRIMRVDRRDHAAQTFAEFLKDTGQTPRVIERFWAPVVVSACNLDCARVSASSALHVFQEGFLAARSAADIGVPGVPLLDLYERAESIIAAAGGRVVLGAGVETLDETSATTTDGERFHAGAVVCAVPVERVRRIVSPDVQARDDRFARLDAFTHSPILGVHLTFDRPVLPDLPGRTGQPIPHAVLVERSTQWIFRKDDPGCYVHAVISAADDWVDLTEAQIGDRVLTDLRACSPRAQDATLVGVRAVKEKLATFAPVPGLEDSRPEPAGPSRLVLAGDYTNTGWPATMEGATRSGYAAAAAVLGTAPEQSLVPSLPVAPLGRLLGLKSA